MYLVLYLIQCQGKVYLIKYVQNVNKDIQCLSPAKNGEYNRTREKWQLSDKLFEIATRAVSDDRTKRQQSIRQFTAEWEAAQ